MFSCGGSFSDALAREVRRFTLSHRMLSGVNIICFAASYAVALVLEISRLFFRSGVRGAVMIGFAGAGLFAHTVFLGYRAADAVGSPLSSKQDWYLLAAWVLVVTYLYLTYYHPKTSFGVFILPLVLGLTAVGALVADSEPFAREPASKVWGAIHAVSILLATVSVLVGFAAGLMYLGQAYRLKRRLPPQRGLRLPSLEWLQRTNGQAIVISLLMLGVGIAAGVILNLINKGRNVELLPWSDPFVLSTLVMFGWLLLAAAVGLFYKPAREGHKVAYLTLASFVFLVIALGIGLSVLTQHRGVPRRQGTEIRGRGLGASSQRSGARGQRPEVRVQGSGIADLRRGGCGPAKRPHGFAISGGSLALDPSHPDAGLLLPHAIPPQTLQRLGVDFGPRPSSLAPRPWPLAPGPSPLVPHPRSLTAPGDSA